jgi:autophagy-related protein 13
LTALDRPTRARLTNFFSLSFVQQFPFATQSPIGDLAKFYRECFNAPTLESFTLENAEPVFEDVEDEAVCDLTKQLEQFETSLNDFDGLITSLCESENQSNS